MAEKKKAIINKKYCVGCGCCVRQCPKGAIHVEQGVYASVNPDKCIGCGICAKACPASVIGIEVPK